MLGLQTLAMPGLQLLSLEMVYGQPLQRLCVLSLHSDGHLLHSRQLSLIKLKFSHQSPCYSTSLQAEDNFYILVILSALDFMPKCAPWTSLEWLMTHI